MHDVSTQRIRCIKSFLFDTQKIKQHQKPSGDRLLVNKLSYQNVAAIIITISMIKCPQMAHFSDVCWKPEY